MDKVSSKTPRVLIIIATDPIGGPGKGIFQFLEHAPHECFDYLLCNFNLRNKPVGQFVDEARRRKLNLILLDQRLVIDPCLLLQVRDIILKNKINIIQTHGYKAAVIGFFMKKFYSIPWVGFAHGYIDIGKKLRLYNRLDKMLLKYADSVVAVSESMKELLINTGLNKDKIKVIYNAIDKTDVSSTVSAESIKEYYGIKQNEKILGVVGRLSPEKGQIIFLKAFEKLNKAYPNTKALLIGDGPDKEVLMDYCKKNRLEGNVVFTGYQENVANFYQIIDICVLPSFTEGLPNAALEAMLFGIPIIATSVGGVPEVISANNGILVPPDNPDAITNKMIELMQNDALRISMGLKGMESLYPRFSPTERANKIINLYKTLLK